MDIPAASTNTTPSEPQARREFSARVPVTLHVLVVLPRFVRGRARFVEVHVFLPLEGIRALGLFFRTVLVQLFVKLSGLVFDVAAFLLDSVAQVCHNCVVAEFTRVCAIEISNFTPNKEETVVYEDKSTFGQIHLKVSAK